MENPLKFSHKLLTYYVDEGDTAIDSTVGNGNDTIKLASLVGKTGKVIGFDIQEEAIEETKKKLVLTGLSPQVDLHQMGHEKMEDVLGGNKNISAVVFNLGYLPKGDKSVITTPETTLEAIKQGLRVLRPGGLILIMVYYGHQGGEEEKNAVVEYVENLSQKEYDVLQYKFINQKNKPPFLLAIEKK